MACSLFRKARIDAPGALHPIIVRGIEHWSIFSDDKDQYHFVARLGEIVTDTAGFSAFGDKSGASMGIRKAPTDCQGSQSFVLLGGSGCGLHRHKDFQATGGISTICEHFGEALQEDRHFGETEVGW